MSPAKRGAAKKAGSSSKAAAGGRKVRTSRAAPGNPRAGKSEPRTSYRVAKLRSGTVIDHLPAGTALRCLALLGIEEDGIVTVGLNLPSRTQKRKDILKVENRILTAAELARLALYGPRATVSIIDDYEIVRKVPLELPTVLDNVLSCPNPSCITHHDPVAPRVRVEQKDPLRLRCHYCERRIRREEMELL